MTPFLFRYVPRLMTLPFRTNSVTFPLASRWNFIEQELLDLVLGVVLTKPHCENLVLYMGLRFVSSCA